MANQSVAHSIPDDGGDYELVRKIIALIGENWREQPSLSTMAVHAGVSEGHLLRVFTQWAGISPKQFIQALTLDSARNLLQDSASILDTSYEVGLSGPGRLHDLFVSHEAMPPGIYKAKGEGLVIHYGFHISPFGKALVMVTAYGLAGVAFADASEETAALTDMMGRWPNARYEETFELTAPFAQRIFDPTQWHSEQPLKVTLIGTDFEIRVWETLLSIPMGKATSYSDIAQHLGKPNAARAVGSAVGRNPISFVVPCHRVLGKSGSLCGYHWGLTRKRAILGWEKGQTLEDNTA